MIHGAGLRVQDGKCKAVLVGSVRLTSHLRHFHVPLVFECVLLVARQAPPRALLPWGASMILSCLISPAASTVLVPDVP